MKVALLGAPGVGKGTYADKLSQHYKIPHISTGDLFRAKKEDGTDLGNKIKALIDNGQFVDDETTINVVLDRIKKPDCKKGYILDGFPRTMYQAENFDEIDVVLYFNARKEIIVERLAGRRTCENKACQAIYHIKNNPPNIHDICNKCGGHLLQRKDERPEVVEKRLEIFEEKTFPLIDFYKEEGILVEIDANRTIEEIVKDSIKRLDKYLE